MVSKSRWFPFGDLTSAKITPYLRTFSRAFSVDLSMSGEYPFNNPSSSWSDDLRDFAYANYTISRLEWAVAKGQTVAFAKNCSFRGK